MIPFDVALTQQSVKSKMKQTSYRVMIGLNVLLWLLQTISNVLTLYLVWLAFIKYAGDPDQSLLVLEGATEPSHTIAKIRDLLGSMPPAIANSIMASVVQLNLHNNSLID
jgi:hypothetical protein